MPVKIRLQRHGKKANAYFHIVIADGRAPRDGKFIEKIGTYNPTTNPASITIDTDKALGWLQKGAQPTDTCKAILSYKGVMYKNHLAKGITKGALTQAAADAKFDKWIAEKEAKVSSKTSGLANKKQDENKKRLAAETAVKNAKAEKIAAKAVPPADEVAAPVVEEVAAPATDAPAAEAAAE